MKISDASSVKKIEKTVSYLNMIDLHTHTSHSDGGVSTVELLLKAKECGIKTISITDHDAVSALDEAEAIASDFGINFVPGIEITSSYKRYQLHFLGYFFDYTDKNFVSRLRELQDARVVRAKKIIEKLNGIKIPLKFESVLGKPGTQNSIGRPHIANTMVEEGFAETYDEVFQKYIGIGKPAYEANYPFPPEEAIKMISQAGGLSFIAHPSHYLNEEMLSRLVKLGLDGVEVIHPSHSNEETEYYKKFADENSLLKCGGSDFHGGLKNDGANLGKYFIDQLSFEQMLEKIGKKILE
ncbi:MAG: PHP domain-containing protein [Candidatus Kryptoniota bacterium]